MVKLCFYVPETHLESVKTALFAKGAGQYKAYDQCCWQVRGEGQFRPLQHSQPFLGLINQLEKVLEYKVEMVCDEAIVKDVLSALIKAHPYEEPAYEIYRILTAEDL
ncbi:NGG1p interacting factor NIF3 [Crenothrix sp.]|uniref:NGG1p interacting factor NIF3 n=1 Tax=Crenothrix sp. TaxID=3100433 RepID=UPI00374D38B9